MSNSLMCDVTMPAVVMPYATADAPFGPTMRPYKVRPNGTHGEFLTDDECAVLAYIRWLEADRSRLADRIAELQAGPEAKPESEPAAGGKGKKGVNSR